MSHNYCVCGEQYGDCLEYSYGIFLNFRGLLWQRISKLCIHCDSEYYFWRVYHSLPEVIEAKIGKIIILSHVI